MSFWFLCLFLLDFWLKDSLEYQSEPYELFSINDIILKSEFILLGVAGAYRSSHAESWGTKLTGSWPISATSLGLCLKSQRSIRMNSCLTEWPVIVVSGIAQVSIVLSLTPCISEVGSIVPAYRVRNRGWEVEWFAQGHEATRSQLQVTYPFCPCPHRVWVCKVSQSVKENLSGVFWCRAWVGWEWPPFFICNSQASLKEEPLL